MEKYKLTFGGKLLSYDKKLAATSSDKIFGMWFLPSQGELIRMYNELHAFNVGGFQITTYWSSSEDQTITNGRQVNFLQGSQSPIAKGNLNPVRPVRTFTLIEETPTYALRDVSPSGGFIFSVESINGGYQYYEAASNDLPGTYPWSNITNQLVGNRIDDGNLAFGRGFTNSYRIVNQPGHTNSAAKACIDYVLITT